MNRISYRISGIHLALVGSLMINKNKHRRDLNFKEINPKHDKYNYKGNIKQATQLKNKIAQIEYNVFGLTRWLLFSGILEEEGVVQINDPQLQKTYELEPAWDKIIIRKRLQGIADWYLDTDFKPGGDVERDTQTRAGI